jgi:hypothetical protein
VEAHVFEHVHSLQDGDAVPATTSQVVNFTTGRLVVEFQEQAGHITTVNLVAHLLSLVTIDSIRFTSHRAVDDIGKVPV